MKRKNSPTGGLLGCPVESRGLLCGNRKISSSPFHWPAARLVIRSRSSVIDVRRSKIDTRSVTVGRRAARGATTNGQRTRPNGRGSWSNVCFQPLVSIIGQPCPFSSEFATVLLGVKCCSHPLLLHAGASARRARSHPGVKVVHYYVVRTRSYRRGLFFVGPFYGLIS